MRFDKFLTLLQDRTDFEYQGSSEGTFQGLVCKPQRAPLHRQFRAIVDPAWGPFSASRYSVPDDRMPRAVEAVIANGGRGFVLPRRFRGANFLDGVDCFFVDDTLEFSLRAAEVILQTRGRSKLTVVTGSAGKTTTKAMLVQAMHAAVPADHRLAVRRRANTVPTVLAQLTRADRFRHMVLEVAASVMPVFRSRGFSMNADVSILTSIAEAHLEAHGSIEGVARDKGDVFTDPPPGGTAIINLDTKLAEDVVRRAVREGRQLVTYGRNPEATIRLVDYDVATGQVEADIGRERITYVVGAPGEHMALNSLAVLATLRAHQYSKWRAGIDALADFEPVAGRGNVYDLPIQPGVSIKMIDESYNANPASMRVALQSFVGSASAHDGRRVAILGDMMELGDVTETAHRELAPDVRAAGFEEVHLVGEHMAVLRDALKAQPNLHYWPDVDALTDRLPRHLRNGDIVLAKASRSTGLFHAIRAMVKGAEAVAHTS